MAMKRIDGLTFEEVKYNIYAFARDKRVADRKYHLARSPQGRAKWARKSAEAAFYLENNKRRMEQFQCEAVEAVGSD